MVTFTINKNDLDDGLARKKRNSFQISVEILRVASQGAKKSHIVYKANLNFKIVKGFLNSLKKAGLLSGPEGEQKIYRTTDKGIDFIQHYEGLKDFMR